MPISDASCDLADVVLDEHLVFEHADLDAAVLRADDHLAVDGLAAREELGLGDDRAAATCVTAVAAALLLGLESRRALDPLRLGDQLGLARRAHLDDRVRRVVRSGPALVARAAARATAHRAGLLAVAVPRRCAGSGGSGLMSGAWNRIAVAGRCGAGSERPRSTGVSVCVGLGCGVASAVAGRRPRVAPRSSRCGCLQQPGAASARRARSRGRRRGPFGPGCSIRSASKPSSTTCVPRRVACASSIPSRRMHPPRLPACCRYFRFPPSLVHSSTGWATAPPARVLSRAETTLRAVPPILYTCDRLLALITLSQCLTAGHSDRPLLGVSTPKKPSLAPLSARPGRLPLDYRTTRTHVRAPGPTREGDMP